MLLALPCSVHPNCTLCCGLRFWQRLPVTAILEVTACASSWARRPVYVHNTCCQRTALCIACPCAPVHTKLPGLLLVQHCQPAPRAPLKRAYGAAASCLVRLNTLTLRLCHLLLSPATEPRSMQMHECKVCFLSVLDTRTAL